MKAVNVNWNLVNMNSLYTIYLFYAYSSNHAYWKNMRDPDLFVPLPLQKFTERTEKMNMSWLSKVLNLENMQDYFPVLNFPSAMVFIYWIKI